MLPNELFLGIHMYGVMTAIGVLCAFGVLLMYGKKKGLPQDFTDFIFYDGILAVFLGFGSAALFQAVYNYIDNPAAGFNFNSGFTFIGGLIGGVSVFLIGWLIFRQKYKNSLFDALSIIPCSILVGHAFGRIGCFFAGCCYGKETDSFLGVKFPHLAEKVHPTQLYESAFLFAMFALCSWLVLKKDFKYNMSLYAVSYGIFRFVLEYLRGDDRGRLLGFISPSQFWSLLMIGVGVGVYFLTKKHFEQSAQAAEQETAAVEDTAELSDE